ncbi:YbaB/EbfC family nucleoid-associated protein [Thermincola potens]|uniref:Nucleoid-associated protein TherJR_1762 n=1 Tax=Thermincola potens (strain JR) TaxID=635013 RepID=D5X7P1_THEPJ|nr:YbaB/EbfC family nucleoid-associated protein [Thermincola potens]ADG82611.1 conserved hypothetical protein [Thermincola potens JR]
MEDQLSNLLAQAQKLQAEITRLQEEMKTKTVEVSVDGGTVRVIATGGQYIKDIFIDPNFIHPANAKVIKSLIVEGVNMALDRAKQMAEKEMKKITGGFTMPKIPGMF